MNEPLVVSDTPLAALEVGYQSRVIQTLGWNPLSTLEVDRQYCVRLESTGARVTIEGDAPWIASLAHVLMHRRGEKLQISVAVVP